MTSRYNDNQPDLNRRRLLKTSALALAAASTPFARALETFSHKLGTQAIQSVLAASAYGPIRPARDEATGLELLQLPEGFSYTSFSWTGDVMADGHGTPPGHDGMGVIGETGDGNILLVRNHELGPGQLITAPACYDSLIQADGLQAGGGNTLIHFPRNRGTGVTTTPSLGGTLINCAGGVTPWGTWLSCEETIADNTPIGGRRHGYVFEVTDNPATTTAEPIIGMGRFKHEAVTIDPKTGVAYLTEDNRNMSPLYRFVPADRSQTVGSLHAGGRLQAAKVKGVHRAELLTPQPGDEYELEWVNIPDPDMDPAGIASGPYLQARDAGALSLSRGEGIRYADGLIYIVDTSAGRNEHAMPGHGKGAVWLLDPAGNRLRCVFASPDAVVGNNPDNVTVSPRGGVVLCEDGSGVEDEFGFGERVLGLTRDGNSFIFAKNNIVLDQAGTAAAGKLVQPGDYRHEEIAGACFDDSGEYLFFNIQTPGITFAVWGPWEKGPL